MQTAKNIRHLTGSNFGTDQLLDTMRTYQHFRPLWQFTSRLGYKADQCFGGPANFQGQPGSLFDTIARRFRVNAALETEGGVGVDTQNPRFSLNDGRIEVGRFEKNAGGRCRHHAVQSAHHARHCYRTGLIGNQQHIGLQRNILLIQ